MSSRALIGVCEAVWSFYRLCNRGIGVCSRSVFLGHTCRKQTAATHRFISGFIRIFCDAISVWVQQRFCKIPTATSPTITGKQQALKLHKVWKESPSYFLNEGGAVKTHFFYSAANELKNCKAEESLVLSCKFVIAWYLKAKCCVLQGNTREVNVSRKLQQVLSKQPVGLKWFFCSGIWTIESSGRRFLAENRQAWGGTVPPG